MLAPKVFLVYGVVLLQQSGVLGKTFLHICANLCRLFRQIFFVFFQQCHYYNLFDCCRQRTALRQ